MYSFIMNIIIQERATFFLLKMIRALVMVLHLPMLKTLMPANVTILFKIMFPLVQFDIFDDRIINLFFSIDEDGE